MCDLIYCLAVFQPFRINCSFISPEVKKKERYSVKIVRILKQSGPFIFDIWDLCSVQSFCDDVMLHVATGYNSFSHVPRNLTGLAYAS